MALVGKKNRLMAFDRKAFSRSNGSLMTGVMVADEGLVRRVLNMLVRRALPERLRIRIHPTAFMRGLHHVHPGDTGIVDAAIAECPRHGPARRSIPKKEAWIAV